MRDGALPELIRVVGEVACSSADVEADEWIPLTVSWWPRAQAQPLYLRVTGATGGELELKVDPGTGALVELIVIDEPPALPQRRREDTSDATLGTTPAVDRSPWGLGDEDHEDVEWKPPVFIVLPDLAISREGELTVLRFSASPLVEWLRCGDVEVGVSAERTLVCVKVSRS